MRFGADRVLALITLVSATAVPALGQVEIAPGTGVRFASAEESSRLLSQRDGFVAAMSPFDRSARLQTDKDVTEAEYLAFVAQQTLKWTDPEVTALAAVLERFRKATADLDLRLPPVVFFLKTTGLEEGRAAYCRGSSVVLPVKVIGGHPAELETTVFHELFHVCSSHHPEKRAALYRIIGFEVAPEIALPEPLRPRKITNPDAPRIDSVIWVRVGEGGVRRPVTPVLIAAGKPTEGFLDLDKEFRLLVLDERDRAFRTAAGADGQPQLLNPSAVPDYLDQIGRNTCYVIHPEEILAENFVLLIQRAKPVPTPRILEQMRALLTK